MEFPRSSHGDVRICSLCTKLSTMKNEVPMFRGFPLMDSSLFNETATFQILPAFSSQCLTKAVLPSIQVSKFLRNLKYTAENLYGFGEKPESFSLFSLGHEPHPLVNPNSYDRVSTRVPKAVNRLYPLSPVGSLKFLCFNSGTVSCEILLQ